MEENKMKRFYLAVQLVENERPRMWVYCFREGQDIIGHLNRRGTITATICSTKKQAYEIVNAFNAMVSQTIPQ